MYIDKYKKDDGYYDEDDCYYETAKDFIQTKILGFCGCGRPEDNLEYIRDGLAHINAPRSKNMTHEQHSEWFKKWVKRGHEIFGNELSRYFFFYWCDKEGLTEHGSSIPGWLTPKGEELLEDLNEIIAQPGNSPDAS